MGRGTVDMPSWKWAAASSRGTSHEKTGARLQDAYVCFVPDTVPESIFAIVCDGAGTAEFGGQGASLVCRSIAKNARLHFARSAALPSNELIESWFDESRDLIFAVAGRRDRQPRDFASTAVCVISTIGDSVIAHVGDGCAVLKDADLGKWIAPSWPDHGEYASTTYFVTDEPSIQLRISKYEGRIGALAVFSDGIERLALDFASKTPSDRFFERVIAPIASSQLFGRDAILSRQLKEFLASSALNARTDDDKSLVLAART
jgi:hypothetical protein